MFAYTVSEQERSKYISEGLWLGFTLASAVDQWSAKRPEKIAVSCEKVKITYRELAQLSNALAIALQAIGITKGDVVSVQLPNIPEFVITAVAVSRLGAVFNPFPMTYRRNEVEFILKLSQTKAVICLHREDNSQYEKMLQETKSGLTSLREIIVVGEPDHKKSLSYSNLLEKYAWAPNISHADAEDIFTLYYTSGTTGTPKGVLHTYQSALSNAFITGKLFDLDENEVILSLSPFSSAFGSFSMNISLVHGVQQVLIDKFTVEKTFELLTKEKVSFVFSVPSAGYALINSEEAKRFQSNWLQKFLFSGAPLSAEAARNISALFKCKVLQLWGMTETYGGAVTRLDDPLELAGLNTGKFAPGWEAVVLDDRGQPLPRGAEGELAIKGPFLFAGYFQNPEANAAGFNKEGWFLTQDLAVIDEQGYLRITGRKGCY